MNKKVLQNKFKGQVDLTKIIEGGKKKIYSRRSALKVTW